MLRDLPLRCRLSLALPLSALHRARWSTFIIFLSNGVIASWAARIPAIQQQLHLSPGMLGLALFGAPVSAVLTMPFFSRLAAHLGSHVVSRWASLAACLALILPALAPNALWLFLAVGALGASMGAG
jgi:MFS family permease